jgi:hypothetical protein
MFIVGLVAVVALVATAGGAFAAPKASSSSTLANLKVTADSVQIKTKGAADFIAAKNGQEIKQGDTIKTDPAGRAEIDYTDGSLTRLGASTLFTISKLTNKRGGRQTQGTLSVGETWNRAAKVSETGSFEVKAGGTTAAVEGTAFVVTCVPKADGTPQQVTCTVTAVVDNIAVDSDAWDVTTVTDAQ